MLAHEIRRKYLEFFQERGHLFMPSAPLAPIDVLGNPDNSTLFTGSGMQQFKPYFAGTAVPPNRRVCTVQKCVRTGDIDSVGDFSHCTLFEMLGNFSFGDYFKADVIPWTWEFLTQVVGLDPERFCVTVYVEDNEAYDIWHNVVGLPADRIHRQGEDKNYWPANVISAGPDGPCGPCSEIFYRVAPLEEMTTDPNLTPGERYTIDDDAGRWLEVWNNVFTQFNRATDAQGKISLTPLPQKNNDTGAGFDRIVCVSQGKTSVFETDLFAPTLARIGALADRQYTGTMSPVDFAFRVVAEHTRSMVFCIADGILPANEGRGYVLRYIMRRAIRYGKTALGFEAPFLHEVAPSIIEQMGDFYPELIERRELILSTIRAEEERFRRTLDNGIRLLTEMLESGTVQQTHLLPGADAFMLYDTYGFPLKLTEDLAAERGIGIDMAGFEHALAQQRLKSQQGSNIERAVFGDYASGKTHIEYPATVFLGYGELETKAKVIALMKFNEPVAEVTADSVEVGIILDQTPFYAESGGQVGDKGIIAADGLVIDVVKTRKEGGTHIHVGRVVQGNLIPGQEVIAQVNASLRRDTMRNHTATHLLQAALRQTLGGHVHQKGSLVSPDRLRFDFTHGQPLTAAEVREVENLVNAEVLADVEVNITADVPIAEARERGAMALFGEKYGNFVRVVEIPGFSLELCGGTHLRHTSQVGVFKIVSESGVASGVRRIEAVTGRGALEFLTRREEILTQVAGLLKSGTNDVLTAAERLLTQRQELERQIRQLKMGGDTAQAADLTPQDVNGIPVIVQALDNADAETIANLADRVAQQQQSVVAVFGTVVEGKVYFAAKVTRDLTGQGLHAGNLVREIAKIAGGGGGGRPDFATAGGRDPGKLQEALDAVPALVAAQRAK
jgi:alanyl-tRNA synthetase